MESDLKITLFTCTRTRTLLIILRTGPMPLGENHTRACTRTQNLHQPHKCIYMSLLTIEKLRKVLVRMQSGSRIKSCPTLQGRLPIFCRTSTGTVSITLVGTSPSEYLYPTQEFHMIHQHFHCHNQLHQH